MSDEQRKYYVLGRSARSPNMSVPLGCLTCYPQDLETEVDRLFAGERGGWLDLVLEVTPEEETASGVRRIVDDRSEGGSFRCRRCPSASAGGPRHIAEATGWTDLVVESVDETPCRRGLAPDHRYRGLCPRCSGR